MNTAAYHGLAGEFVYTVEPHTEASSPALLMTFLTGFGNAIDRGPHILIGATKHYANLFVWLIGRHIAIAKGYRCRSGVQLFRARRS
jgi:hypothetical protein